MDLVVSNQLIYRKWYLFVFFPAEASRVLKIPNLNRPIAIQQLIVVVFWLKKGMKFRSHLIEVVVWLGSFLNSYAGPLSELSLDSNLIATTGARTLYVDVVGYIVGTCRLNHGK